ncbi:RidA family protein, partial [Halococcus agarilyticus]
YYDAVNDVYGDFLTEPYPARSAFEVVKLPVDIDVEIEAMAAVPETGESD